MILISSFLHFNFCLIVISSIFYGWLRHVAFQNNTSKLKLVLWYFMEGSTSSLRPLFYWEPRSPMGHNYFNFLVVTNWRALRPLRPLNRKLRLSMGHFVFSIHTSFKFLIFCHYKNSLANSHLNIFILINTSYLMNRR